jgi:hypothetical protein
MSFDFLGDSGIVGIGLQRTESLKCLLCEIEFAHPAIFTEVEIKVSPKATLAEVT